MRIIMYCANCIMKRIWYNKQVVFLKDDFYIERKALGSDGFLVYND